MEWPTDQVSAKDQPRDQPTSPAPLHERITGAPSPTITRLEKSKGQRGRPRSMRTAVLLAAPFAAAVLLAAVVVSGLGTSWWAALGSAAHPKPSPTNTRAALATPAPASPASPILLPDPTLALNAAMGCANGAPSPSARAIYFGRNFQTGGPPPNEIALTFDDGPTPSTSPPILDFLERTHTPATFFVIGQEAHAWPYLVYREWRDGFAIGAHSWNHPEMPLVPDSQMPHQFTDTLAAIHAAIGQDACIWLWRPPYGEYNARVVRFAQHYGLTTIMWNDDPRDWSRPGVQTIVATVLAEVRPGGIIIMHDGPMHREQTATALPLILAGLRARGLIPVTIPRLLADCRYPGVNTTLSHQRTFADPTSVPSSPIGPPLSPATAPDARTPTLATWDGRG